MTIILLVTKRKAPLMISNEKSIKLSSKEMKKEKERKLLKEKAHMKPLTYLDKPMDMSLRMNTKEEPIDWEIRLKKTQDILRWKKIRMGILFMEKMENLTK